jgi:hypothetical protein
MNSNMVEKNVRRQGSDGGCLYLYDRTRWLIRPILCVINAKMLDDYCQACHRSRKTSYVIVYEPSSLGPPIYVKVNRWGRDRIELRRNDLCKLWDVSTSQIGHSPLGNRKYFTNEEVLDMLEDDCRAHLRQWIIDSIARIEEMELQRIPIDRRFIPRH